MAKPLKVKVEGSTVRTGKVRFGYANVHTPKRNGDSEKEYYSTMIIIDKEDKETIQAIVKAIDAAAERGKSDKWSGKIPANLKKPLRDGDEERPDSEELQGKFFLNAKTLRKPGIVKKDEFLGTVAIEDPAEFYSGCFGQATINFYPYTFSGNKGIGVGLNNLLFLEDGDALSGGGSASSDFGDDD